MQSRLAKTCHLTTAKNLQVIRRKHSKLEICGRSVCVECQFLNICLYRTVENRKKVKTGEMSKLRSIEYSLLCDLIGSLPNIRLNARWTMASFRGNNRNCVILSATMVMANDRTQTNVNATRRQQVLLSTPQRIESNKRVRPLRGRPLWGRPCS